MRTFKVSILIIALFFCKAASAKIMVPALIGDNMVLQQQSAPALWGKANANAVVTVITSWNKKVYTVKAGADGAWKLKVATPTAGGPYEIWLSDGEKLILKNVMIGEVWFCSGQSNMEMALRGNSSPILNANEIILNADNPALRLFTIKTLAKLTPQTEINGQWSQATSESARNFSAIAYQFGEMLQKKLHVPVGLIVSSVGG